MKTTLDQASLTKLFVSSGALLHGHFQLSSGRHSGQYFQCALLLSDPALAGRLGQALAEMAQAGWPKPDTVVSPALGGIIIGHETARALGVRSLFAEREEGRLALRRGFKLKSGEKVLVVEDVITTGKSTGEVLELVRGLGAKPIGAVCIVLRAQEPALGVPVKGLTRLPAESFLPESCPLCAQGEPVVKPGSRPQKLC